MPFSHHSHSGQFCGHAANTLEEVVQNAISKSMTTFCLTEHVARERADFYPEEENDHTPETLTKLYDDFYQEARRLQTAYAAQIQLFVGFEGEWIRDSSRGTINDLLEKYDMDLFVGSVHHVHAVPIDYDTPLYHKARELAGGSDERIFGDYLDAQYEMVKALRPPVVGHFDLIRLKSDEPDRSFQTWPAVWNKVIRNLRFIAGYAGVLELNSSSLRKGMREPYPQVEICEVIHTARNSLENVLILCSSQILLIMLQAFLVMGGRFTLSDDSHGIEQVGLNYGKVLDAVKKAGVSELQVLAPVSEVTHALKPDHRFAHVCWRAVPIAELESYKFWNQ